MLFIILYLGIISSFSTVEPLNAVENGSNNIGSKQVVRIGVIVDLESRVGRMTQNYISMAISDFYAINANYQTRLAPTVKNSGKDAVVAASAALELIKDEQVEAIIGPQRSTEAKFVINLGKTAQVPIISTSATSPSLSPTQNPFFIRTCPDDYSQTRPITSIVQAFGWRQVIVIYEDTEYGNGLIPYLTDSFQQINTRVVYRSVISPSTSSKHELNTTISKELSKIKEKETRVLVVHMTAYLGSQVFKLAKQEGMMSKEYVWIVSDGLSTLLDPMDKKATDSMEGVLGVRPYVPITKRLKELETKMKLSGLNLFGLWAYDTIWALAKAVELVSHDVNNSSSQTNLNTRNRGRDQEVGLRVSEYGPQILKKIRSSRFEGLSGEFRLIRGQLQVDKFEIINMRRKTGERVIGFWTPKKGICGDLGGNNISQVQYSTSMDELKSKIVWPGNYYTKLDVPPPKGWVIPVPGKKLKIGVPRGSAGSENFVNMKWDPITLKVTNISGFSYDIFVAALQKLPFKVPHEFFAYVNAAGQNNGTYDDLLYQIKLKNYDAVMGDTAIVANRTKFVDFTLPYYDSGIVMIVKVEDDKRNNIWIFLKPLRWDLWLSFGVAFLSTGFIVWTLEHRTNTNLRGHPKQFSTVFLYSFLTPVFAHGEKVENNWSRLVLTIWIFVVFIVTQSYTASLASMLTMQRLQPSFVDVNQLRLQKDYYVGYPKNSYVRELLTGQLKLNESRLRSYTSPEEYHQALSSGSQNGGVDAIFDDIPYAKFFLSKYCSRYIIVGPTYKSDGFGFAFPIGSPLVPHISRAILNVTEDHVQMQDLERKYFAYETQCQDDYYYSAASYTFMSSSAPSSPILSACSFGGLFIFMGLTLFFPCFIYLVNLLPASNAIHSKCSLIWCTTIQMLLNHNSASSVVHSVVENLQTHRNPTTSLNQPAVQMAITSTDHEDQNHTETDNHVDSDHELFTYGCA